VHRRTDGGMVVLHNVPPTTAVNDHIARRCKRHTVNQTGVGV